MTVKKVRANEKDDVGVQSRHSHTACEYKESGEQHIFNDRFRVTFHSIMT